MSIATWPSFLQQLLNADSFNVEFGDTVIRSDNEIGPQKVRRRFTKPVDTYTASINVFQSDMVAFRQFFNTTLNGGATSFYFVDPLTNVTEVFRFSKPPQISPLGSAGHYRITMNWTKMP